MQMGSTEKTAALRELAAVVPELKRTPALLDRFTQALQERERLHTTAIGDGIALPHTRNPLGNLLVEPLLIFGRHPAGIPFGALDGHPVRIFFLLAAPNLTEHLKILAGLSRVLRSPALRQELLEAATAQKILEAMRVAEIKLQK